MPAVAATVDGTRVVAEEAPRRPARRARPRGVARAGAGARHGRPRARAREAGRAGRRRARARGRARRRRTSRAPGTSSRTRSTRSASTWPGSTASTSAPRPAGSPTSCCSAARARVIALDVGYGQLHDKVRDDPRVTVLERVNARSLTELPFAPQLVTCDVSFISVQARAAAGARARGARAGRRSCSSSRSSRRAAPRRRRASCAISRCGGACVREVAEALARGWRRAARGHRLGPARPEGKP